MDPGQFESLLGYRVWSGPAGSLGAAIAARVAVGQGVEWLACLNPHSYAQARTSARFREALQSADWLVPDGTGVVLASRLLGGGIRERVTGSDVFLAVHNSLSASGRHRVFFLGSRNETLSAIKTRMAADWPALAVAGVYSPPFREAFSRSEVDEMVERVNEAEPDVLWVGMTAPKQEEWIHRAIPRLNVKFAAAVGAVFDFYSGRIKRSHPAFQRAGLEWLPRLAQEPRRLWRRMFISAPIFLSAVLRERVTSRRK